MLEYWFKNKMYPEFALHFFPIEILFEFYFGPGQQSNRFKVEQDVNNIKVENDGDFPGSPNHFYEGFWRSSSLLFIRILSYNIDSFWCDQTNYP